MALHVEDIEIPDPLIAPSLDELLDVAGRSCTWEDPEDFFPTGQMAEDGKAICRPCPARVGCLAYALLHDVDGIWGATTYSQRRALRDRHQIYGVEPVSIPANWLPPRRNRSSDARLVRAV